MKFVKQFKYRDGDKRFTYYQTESKAMITILISSFLYLMGSIIAHFWVWQATHQGISEYGIFFFIWLLATTIFGLILIISIITFKTTYKTGEK